MVYLQNLDILKQICLKLSILQLKKKQEKTIRIISFKDRTETTNPLFKKLKIMKMKDIYSNL